MCRAKHVGAERGCFNMANSSDVKIQIARQFFIALRQRGIDEILSIIESYGDTASDEEALSLVQKHNAVGATSPTRPARFRRQARK
jgi:hypothetical protein